MVVDEITSCKNANNKAVVHIKLCPFQVWCCPAVSESMSLHCLWLASYRQTWHHLQHRIHDLLQWCWRMTERQSQAICSETVVKLKFHGTDTGFLADFQSSRGSRRGAPWQSARIGSWRGSPCRCRSRGI